MMSALEIAWRNSVKLSIKKTIAIQTGSLQIVTEMWCCSMESYLNYLDTFRNSVLFVL